MRRESARLRSLCTFLSPSRIARPGVPVQFCGAYIAPTCASRIPRPFTYTVCSFDFLGVCACFQDPSLGAIRCAVENAPVHRGSPEETIPPRRQMQTTVKPGERCLHLPRRRVPRAFVRSPGDLLWVDLVRAGPPEFPAFYKAAEFPALYKPSQVAQGLDCSDQGEFARRR